MNSIIDRVLGVQRKRETARLADFSDVVRRIADGHEPDAEQVDAIMHDADKSIDDLREAVEKLQTRMELKAKVDRIPALTTQQREIEKQIAEANRVLEAAEARHAELVFPLQASLKDVRDEACAGQQAKAELHCTCENPTLFARTDEVVKRQSVLTDEMSQLRASIERLRDLARADRDRADSLVFDSRSDDLRKRADEHEAEASRLQKRLHTVEKEQANLAKQETAIQEQMLEP